MINKSTWLSLVMASALTALICGLSVKAWGWVVWLETAIIGMVIFTIIRSIWYLVDMLPPPEEEKEVTTILQTETISAKSGIIMLAVCNVLYVLLAWHLQLVPWREFAPDKFDARVVYFSRALVGSVILWCVWGILFRIVPRGKDAAKGDNL